VELSDALWRREATGLLVMDGRGCAALVDAGTGGCGGGSSRAGAAGKATQSALWSQGTLICGSRCGEANSAETEDSVCERLLLLLSLASCLFPFSSSSCRKTGRVMDSRLLSHWARRVL
jgi:hypothetical protein